VLIVEEPNAWFFLRLLELRGLPFIELHQAISLALEKSSTPLVKELAENREGSIRFAPLERAPPVLTLRSCGTTAPAGAGTSLERQACRLLTFE
jgi:hypothetical protein